MEKISFSQRKCIKKFVMLTHGIRLYNTEIQNMNWICCIKKERKSG